MSGTKASAAQRTPAHIGEPAAPVSGLPLHLLPAATPLLPAPVPPPGTGRGRPGRGRMGKGAGLSPAVGLPHRGIPALGCQTAGLGAQTCCLADFPAFP